MTTAKLHHSWSNGDNWVLDFVPLQKGSILAASLSNGVVNTYSMEKSNRSQIGSFKVHDYSISKLRKVEHWDKANDNLFVTCSVDSVKVCDIRQTNNNNKPVFELHNDKNIPFLSVDSNHGFLAAGTELRKQDSEIHIWDLRNTAQTYKSLVDSQHDDVTDLRFHPTSKDMILSGSTDGCVNIYDLMQADEDDALYQVINFSSIHSAGWLNAKRIYTLSHMLTFAIHELNDITTEENIEPEPLDFGDVREKWGCEYVVDIYPTNGFIGVGSLENNGNQIKLLQFEDEKVNHSDKNAVVLPQPHGDEIARCLYVPKSGSSKYIVSGGEDGKVNVWKSSSGHVDDVLAGRSSKKLDKKSEKKIGGKPVRSHRHNTSSQRFKPY